MPADERTAASVLSRLWNELGEKEQRWISGDLERDVLAILAAEHPAAPGIVPMRDRIRITFTHEELASVTQGVALQIAGHDIAGQTPPPALLELHARLAARVQQHAQLHHGKEN